MERIPERRSSQKDMIEKDGEIENNGNKPMLEASKTIQSQKGRQIEVRRRRSREREASLVHTAP